MTKKSTDHMTQAYPVAGLLRQGRPLVMGVLNVTPDSFSDGGRYVSVRAAVDYALAMEQQGADIVDVGGESSRPGAAPLNSKNEQARVLPVIEAIREKSAIPISIDTYHAETARLAVKAGANMINDISALRFDDEMAAVVQEAGLPIVLMHMLGEPLTMQQDPRYEDCVAEILTFLLERITFCEEAGIARANIIVDPGIGFGKRLEDNLAILAHLKRFKQFDRPLLVGASRKSFIGKLSGASQDSVERVGGSIAAALTAVANGADIVRVHDVGATVEALRVFDAIRRVTW